jgi:hypothetical protein
MERRVRPGVRTTDETVLHWIVVNVVEVPFELLLVTDCVLPEAALPHTSTTVAPSRVVPRLFAATACKPLLGELLLDEHPTAREVGVVSRKSPDHVQVVGQEHQSVCCEWPTCVTFAQRPPQRRTRCIVAEEALPVLRDHSEEEGPARHMSPAIHRHARSIAWEQRVVRTADPTHQILVGSAVRTIFFLRSTVATPPAPPTPSLAPNRSCCGRRRPSACRRAGLCLAAATVALHRVMGR